MVLKMIYSAYLIIHRKLRYKTKTFLGLTLYFFPCIFISSSGKLMESLNTRKMRTLILLFNNSENMNEKELFVISKFKYLRVSTLSQFSLSNSFEKIEEFKISLLTWLWKIGKSLQIRKQSCLLKSLEIRDTNLGMEKAPKDWFKNLTSLENLELYSFSSEQFQVIEMWFKDDLNCLPSLQTIGFYNCYELRALPDWI